MASASIQRKDGWRAAQLSYVYVSKAGIPVHNRPTQTRSGQPLISTGAKQPCSKRYGKVLLRQPKKDEYNVTWRHKNPKEDKLVFPGGLLRQSGGGGGDNSPHRRRYEAQEKRERLSYANRLKATKR